MAPYKRRFLMIKKHTSRSHFFSRSKVKPKELKMMNEEQLQAIEESAVQPSTIKAMVVAVH